MWHKIKRSPKIALDIKTILHLKNLVLPFIDLMSQLN